MRTANRLLPAVACLSAAALAYVSVLATSALADEEPAPMSQPEAIRLREFYRLLDELGDEIWPGFSGTAAPVLLVTAEREYLVGWDAPIPEGFESLGVEQSLGGAIHGRPPVFSPGMEASFPAFGPPAVIVFGTAEATGRESTEWVLTMLHEHLHQVQYASPGYYEEAEKLDLAKSDTSGMWMLNYPFPYQDQEVGRKFSELAAALHAAVTGDGGAGDAWGALQSLLEGLDPADGRYLSFQLWQEGVGRYVELRAAEVAASGFTPSTEFAALADSLPWSEAARREHERLETGLEAASLAEQGRVAFYPVGAALAMLLDRVAPDWKNRYLDEKFALQAYRSPAGSR